MGERDAIVIGSGVNGLAAAITLARAGWVVSVLERNRAVGGSARSEELTLPGFVHDVCSTIHVLANASPFFRELPLAEHGLEFVHPDAPLAHPLDDGTAVMCERSIPATAEQLGSDAGAYRELMEPVVTDWEKLIPMLLGPVRWPDHPIAMGKFMRVGIRSAAAAARGLFQGERARALFAGMAAHSILPLEWAGTAAYGLMLLGGAHGVGWPLARGGSQRLADALADYLRGLGGRIEVEAEVRNIDEVGKSAAVLCDVTPRQLIGIAGHRLPASYVRKLGKFRYGPGVFKMDWALSGPIPWTARECLRAATVHIGGTLEEIADGEAACWAAEHSERPFVLLVQPTLFDRARAPAGKQIAWAYCHVPNGSTVDMSKRIENQIERFAPGFQEIILARSVKNSGEMERHNPNLVGGDITGGAQTIGQMIFRPVLWPSPYVTPARGVYICSASTPPGGGVHGMCGFHAARAALRRAEAAEIQ